MNEMSEQTAQKLLSSLEKMSQDTPFEPKVIDELISSSVNLTLAKISLKATQFAVKLSDATFLTRWYWRLKFIKADNNLTAFKKLIKDLETEVYSSLSIPDIDYTKDPKFK